MSTALHVALFAYLAHIVPVLPTPSYGPEPDVELDLAPAPNLSSIPSPQATPRQAQASRSPAPRSDLTVATRRAPAAPARPPARAIQSTPRVIPPRAPSAAPAPPSSASASLPAAGARAGSGAGAPSGGGGGGGGQHPANLPGDEVHDGVRQFLRATVGCSHEEYLHLNTAERAACDRRVGRDARAVANLKVDALPSEKRAYYDAVQQAYQALHDSRTPVDTGVGGTGTTGQAGHGFGFNCKGGTCGPTLPQGVGTEESGIPKQ